MCLLTLAWWIKHNCNMKKGWTYSSPREEPDSRPESRAKPWGWPESSFAWSSIGWSVGAWWSPRNGQWRWPAGWSWRWCRRGRHRRRTFYSLQKQTTNSGGATAGWHQSERKGITHLSKHPFLVETVDEEDWRLRGRHEEVADCQVHDEVVGQAA